jgi:hypothetical protein
VPWAGPSTLEPLQHCPHRSRAPPAQKVRIFLSEKLDGITTIT